VARVFVEEGEGNLVDCGLGGGDLGEDVDAVALLVDHPFDAADLAVDPAQAVLHLLFVLDVAGVGLVLRHLVPLSQGKFTFEYIPPRGICYSRPMNTPRPYLRIGLFALGLAAVFAVSVAVGSVVDPAETKSSEMEETMDAHGAHATPAHEPAGLGVSADGYTLRIVLTQMERGEEQELRFEIEHGGEVVTEFDELHERRMHLILVRRDGTAFRHLHPEMEAVGTWSVPVSFAAAGVYRVFADFSVTGEQQTLAADLFVSGGEFKARPFPAPQPVAETEGYEVELTAGEPVAGEPTALEFAVAQGDRPVAELQPYLGADGHLVALREGDLAFLHVHPEEEHGAPNEIVFEAEFPTAGRYRLYLQFRHEGRVRTAEFTVEVPR
jgi:hypothetical protein